MSIKAHYLYLLYNIAFLQPFRPILYMRGVGRYSYQHHPTQMIKLRELLLSVDVSGAYLEVGAAAGDTTCWLGRSMKEAKNIRRMYVVDTFSGFTQDDVEEEYQRGKKKGTYDGAFQINSQKWFDESMRHAKLDVTTFKSDCTVFDYTQLEPLAFTLLDVDLYRPVKLALPYIYERTVTGGLIVVDDCNPDDPLWNGAYYAYTEFCTEKGIEPQIIDKFGIIIK